MLVRRLWLIFAALCCLPIAVFVLSLDLFREFGSGDAQQIDLVMGSCLLYTSPSPRDRTRSRMPSSA